MTTVAVIEDDNSMRQMLVKWINGTPGHRCVCACSTSREALVAVPKRKPDAALVDLHLPDESGLACAAGLTEKMPGLPVILLTVYLDTDPIFQAMKAGGREFIVKRFQREEIIQAVADARAGGAPAAPKIARVVWSFSPPPADHNVDGLTAREAEILGLLSSGLSNKEIGRKANITGGTVRIHLGNIFKKLHVRSRTEAAARYFSGKSFARHAPE